MKPARQLASQPVGDQPEVEDNSVAAGTHPAGAPIPFKLRSRAMAWWAGLDSSSSKGMGAPGRWVPAGSQLTPPLAGR